MIKNYITLLSLLHVAISLAQDSRVGVNISNPKASLDIYATSESQFKGVMIPRIKVEDIKVMTPNLTADQNAILTYLTETFPVTERVGSYRMLAEPGYYFWDGVNNLWLRMHADLRMVANHNHISADAGVGSTGTSAGTGESNVGIGSGALSKITTGSHNIAIGLNAGRDITSQSDIIAIGQNVLRENKGADNIAVGGHAMLRNTTGQTNMALGTNALRSNTIGNSNIAIGTNTLYENEQGSRNVAIGGTTLYKNKANDNVAIGQNALNENITGEQNVAVGPDALRSNNEGGRNLGLGFEALRNNKVGTDNLAIGTTAMRVNHSGNNNIALGTNALEQGMTTMNNLAIGYRALQNLSFDRQHNIAIGKETLLSNTHGMGNIAIGNESLKPNENGSYNIAIGEKSYKNVSTTPLYSPYIIPVMNKVGYNVGIGYEAGYGAGFFYQSYYNGANYIAILGKGVFFIGNGEPAMSEIEENPTLINNAIFIGNAMNYQDAKSHTIVLGNEHPKGINGGVNVGIGVLDPQEKLEVNGGVRIGDTTDECTPEKAGTIRYPKTFTARQQYYFEGCTGNEWVRILNHSLY